jgi:hypothetical protein
VLQLGAESGIWVLMVLARLRCCVLVLAARLGVAMALVLQLRETSAEEVLLLTLPSCCCCSAACLAAAFCRHCSRKTPVAGGMTTRATKDSRS